ncbi:hypothetical protein GCM10028804_19420 [Larkinella terrae]
MCDLRMSDGASSAVSELFLQFFAISEVIHSMTHSLNRNWFRKLRYFWLALELYEDEKRTEFSAYGSNT